ncbi:hypothetical protein LTR36_001332 [Oleoguttula mirabilis]|uniref:Uncharacterized protein n=1 Tax=Oleoguttula mirabilis TaxID=1507867 RepID=A0AAV9JNH2_9PEZI|nr:hypothetical protein LTR36_001332 [Oleoguttula mirabilis]
MLNLNLGIPAENGGTSRQAKRRSLLPQFTRKVSGEGKDTIKEDEETDGPRRVVAPAPVPDEPRKAMEETDRRAMPPPSRLSRPTSTYGAGGLGRAPSVRSHAREAPKGNDARADALARLTGSAPSVAPRTTATDSGLKRTSSTRLPQGPPPPRGLARTASVKVKDPHTRINSTTTTASSIADKRTSVGRPRPPSIDSSLRTHAPSAPSPASPASSTTSRQSITRITHMPPPPRPFSTYQQHYSPAKSALPKPPLPPTRPARSVTVTEEEIPMSFEITKQQIELLQLSLLHQASRKTLQEYDASAKRKLGRKQAKLRKDYESIRAVELDQQRVANLTALDAWCHEPALLVEHLQILSKVYAEVSALAEEGSRYAQLVATFEVWIVDTESAATRLAGFAEALPPEWHKAHTSLALRLRSLQRDFEMLPPAPTADERPSSLEILMRSCKGLLDGMLKELEVMSKLEKGILEREMRRVDEEVRALTGGEADSKPQWVPVWQSVA